MVVVVGSWWSPVVGGTARGFITPLCVTLRATSLKQTVAARRPFGRIYVTLRANFCLTAVQEELLRICVYKSILVVLYRVQMVNINEQLLLLLVLVYRS